MQRNIVIDQGETPEKAREFLQEFDFFKNKKNKDQNLINHFNPNVNILNFIINQSNTYKG